MAGSGGRYLGRRVDAENRCKQSLVDIRRGAGCNRFGVCMAGRVRTFRHGRYKRKADAGGSYRRRGSRRGLGTAAFVSYMARETNPAFTATQLALFTSLSAVPRTVINSFAGYLIEWLGYVPFFQLCFILALPGMLLLLKVAPWNGEKLRMQADERVKLERLPDIL